MKKNLPSLPPQLFLVIVIAFLLCRCSDKEITQSKTSTIPVENATTKHLISDQDFNTCMSNANLITNIVERPTRTLDSAYAQRVSTATSETQVRSILSERFTANDVNLLVNSAYSCKNLTANISNTKIDWHNKVTLYMDTTNGGGVGPMHVPGECEKNRDDGLTSCDQTEWFMIGCSILGGFINPWLGAGVAIETKIGADGCRSSVQTSYQHCIGH